MVLSPWHGMPSPIGDVEMMHHPSRSGDPIAALPVILHDSGSSILDKIETKHT
jgi:hypothetical protein